MLICIRDKIFFELAHIDFWWQIHLIVHWTGPSCITTAITICSPRCVESGSEIKYDQKLLLHYAVVLILQFSVLLIGMIINGLFFVPWTIC